MKHIPGRLSRSAEGRRILKYGLVGVINTLLTFAVFELLLFFGVSAFVSNLAGYAVGIINSFLWNKLWVFRSHGNRWSVEAALFALGTALCYAVQWFAFDFLLRRSNEHVAQIGGMAVYTGLNYLYNRLVTFRWPATGARPLHKHRKTTVKK